MKSLESESPEEQLEALRVRKEEILTRLYSIDIALGEDGIAIEYEPGSVAAKRSAKKVATSYNPNTGIRINGKLSFRGKQKAAEYFSRLDENKDGFLTIDDFRAMKSLTSSYGLVHEHRLRDFEAWRMYMDDLGVKIDDLGRVDMAGFVKYRTAVEASLPLSQELSLLGLDFLPSHQIMWRRLKELIEEVYLHRNLSQHPVIHDIGNLLQLDDISFILANLDIVFTRNELVASMLRIAPFELVIAELMRRSFRKFYAQSSEVFSVYEGGTFKEDLVVKVKHLLYISPARLTAWLFSRRPEPKQSDLYRNIIQLKQKVLYYWRRVDHVTKLMFDAGVQLRLRLVFRDFTPMAKIITKDEKTFLHSGVSIGPKSNSVSDGMAVAWNLSKLLNPEEFCLKMQLPKDFGTIIAFEFQLRLETTPLSAKRAADAIAIFLRTNFDDELKQNAQYRGVTVTISENDGDGAPVIRFAFTFKRLVSIDAYLDYMFIPYKLNELVSDFGGSIRTSLSLFDFLNSQTVSLESSFTVNANIRITYVRNILLHILKRVILALSSGIAHADIVPPEDAEERREMNLHHKLQKYFPTVVSLCESLFSQMQGLKSGAMNFRFKTIFEFISRFRMDSLWLKQLVPLSVHPADLGLHIAEMFKSWLSGFEADMLKEFDRLRTSIEDRLAEQEAERTRVLLGLAAGENPDASVSAAMASKADLMSKLEDLGIKAGAADFIDEESTNYKTLLREMEILREERDVQAYQAYERLWHTCSGIHAIEILSGKSRLAVNCQGMDIFDILPAPPSLIKVKEACDKRSRRFAKKK